MGEQTVMTTYSESGLKINVVKIDEPLSFFKPNARTSKSCYVLTVMNYPYVEPLPSFPKYYATRHEAFSEISRTIRRKYGKQK